LEHLGQAWQAMPLESEQDKGVQQKMYHFIANLRFATNV
jgi:hypothetical protein